jgi:hypothetical protein
MASLQLIFATIEAGSDLIWIDVVAICLEKSSWAEGKLFSVAFHKSIDPKSVGLLAGVPHIIDDVFNGSWMPFGLSREAN